MNVAANLPSRGLNDGFQTIAHFAEGNFARVIAIYRQRNETGLRVRPGRSLLGAEIYVTILTGFGLRQLLHFGGEQQAMEQVIGIMIVIVLIGVLVDKTLFSPIERFLHRRWGTSQ
jgi:hypothetical protein